MDASNADRERQIAAVRSVLSEVGAQKVPTIEVFNKCDLLDDREQARLRALYPGALCVSARFGDGRDDLVAAMETRLGLDTTRMTFTFSTSDEESRERISRLYRTARILSHVASDGQVSIEAELPRRLVVRYSADAGE